MNVFGRLNNVTRVVSGPCETVFLASLVTRPQGDGSRAIFTPQGDGSGAIFTPQGDTGPVIPREVAESRLVMIHRGGVWWWWWW